MPDERNPSADILSQLTDQIRQGITDNQGGRQDTILLASIDETLKSILKNGGSMSQSNARSSMPGSESDIDVSRIFRNRAKSSGKGFLDGFEDALWDSLLGSDFKKKLGESLGGFADSLGVNIKDVPNELGKRISKDLISSISKSKIGGSVVSEITGMFSTASAGINAGISAASAEIAAGGSAVSAIMSGAAVALTPELLAIGAAAAVAVVGLEAISPALEGTAELFKEMGKSFTRYNDQQEQYLAAQQKRLKADVETLITEPFKILEDAAQNVYDAWDKNVRVINATQGYNKADLQNLLANYSQRLKSEGLDKVITSTNIIDSLASILETGLSGKVAEEFAYQATKLNASIPTQDFFGYASTYSSLAANAIKNGKSEAEAIKYANQQLQSFASDVLYASRQLSGGFSTGLKNAQSLFDQSVKIATASKTGSPSTIAGVLTSVSAVVGAIAPDLVDSITSAIYDAAVGGNSSQIVALRSLAGINASNTEFLKQVARDPKTVFENLFTKLATYQNMSESNYMEVADKVSEVFGLSREAFQRVDFNYLAQAISQMNLNNASLDENIAHLASGETTTTTEQLRMQQINKYLLDEGLAYVLDNEAARAIQQHMWDEQLAREITESTFAVELQGSALQFLEGIRHTIDNIAGLLNPVAWIKRGVSTLVATAAESVGQQADVRKLLELSKVGTGNATSLYQLTTTGTNLRLTDSLINMMGGRSAYGFVSNAREIMELTTTLSPYTAILETASKADEYISLASNVYSNIRQTALGLTGYQRDVGSKYSWGTIGKSTQRALSIIPSGSSIGVGTSGTQSGTSVSASNLSTTNINKMLGTIEEYATARDDKGQFKYGYTDWAKTAKQYNISNLENALKDAGYEIEDVKQQFTDYQTTSAAEDEIRRRGIEELSWNTVNEHLPKTTEWLEKISGTLDSFLAEWVNYFVEHTAYTEATRYTSSDVERIQKQEKKGSDDAVAALAESLTSNMVDLKDPQVQQNVLLAEILKVLSTIMQQNNNKTTSEQLAESLKGLSLGLLK